MRSASGGPFPRSRKIRIDEGGGGLRLEAPLEVLRSESGGAVTVLTASEAAVQEAELEPFFARTAREYDGEKLLYSSFMLG